MVRGISILALGALLLSTSCKTQSAELADRSISLLEGGLIILEQHRDTPEIAPKMFREYMTHNEAEVKTLSEMAAAIETKGNDSERTALRRRFLEKLKPLNERLRAIAESYRAAPDALEELMRTTQSLKPTSP